MDSIKHGFLKPGNKSTSKRVFKTSLTLLLIVFAFTVSSPSYFQIVKPAMAAGTLTSVVIVPSNNIVNTKTTYDIIFKTATTGTIKSIHISFPSGFDVSAAKKIERTGIGIGWLSAPSSTTLIYTVASPVSVPAGRDIRLEIGKIVNSNTAGSFRVSIATENTFPTLIDGPTLSSNFPIKDVTGDDVSPNFMIRKTLNDDDVGHAHGWNPDTSTRAYAISDSDISGASSSEFVSVMVRSGNPAFCAAASGDAGLFGVYCDSPPGNFSELDYIITKLPAHDDVASSLSASSESTPSSASPSLSSSPHTSALPDIASFNRQDDIASEFP